MVVRQDNAKVFRTSWTIKSFYEADQLCNVVKIRQIASRTLADAINAPDSALTLNQAAEVATKLLVDQKCE